MDYGQTELSMPQSCACGHCQTNRIPNNANYLNNPMLKMLGETTPGLNPFEPVSQLAAYNPYNPPGYADRAVAQTEQRMLSALINRQSEKPLERQGPTALGGDMVGLSFPEFMRTTVTEQTLLNKGKEVMSASKTQHPSPEGFLEFLTGLMGAEEAQTAFNRLKAENGGNIPFSTEVQLTPKRDALDKGFFGLIEELIGEIDLSDLLGKPEQPDTQMGHPLLANVHLVPDQKFADEVRPSAIPQEILDAGKEEVIQNYVTHVIIPDFSNAIIDLPQQFSGKDLLRQQRRLQARLNKLLRYQAKPDAIVVEAINDKYEFAIYQHYTAKLVSYRSITLQEGKSRMEAAEAALAKREADNAVNQKKQELVAFNQNLRLEAADLFSSIGQISNLELHKGLLQLAEKVDLQINPIQKLKEVEIKCDCPGCFLEAINEEVGSEAIEREPSVFDLYFQGNPSASRSRMYAQRMNGIDERNTADLRGALVSAGVPNHSLIGKMGGRFEMTPEQINERFGEELGRELQKLSALMQSQSSDPLSGSLAQGMASHSMSQGMMSHHFQNQE
ncbi:hypothetical protein MZD04_gp055 [Pseudomonas phage Psa21]|uniref:Uncharacterized protein n=1 Tax=Pseudomonas phage Psa21 TaxID=2530023 RepID=A0A481W534_9CAUD|nr:hypothetical protein MZD04_gp055 [Pseudomonas phage Psa21]QBJ02585.1 hypothetical protein PSA21_55 [Pseudomonas phage Psa21]